MSGKSIDVKGLVVPGFMYGTAWKEDRTTDLVTAALAAGFRAIDTANQRRHYFEAAVGAALKASGLPRGELFLQTKYTYARGQDHRLPYNPSAPIATQVAESFESSLEHLGTDRIDSYVLHGPESGHGWSQHDREAWAAMEALTESRRVRVLGVSNVSLDQLQTLCDVAKVPPAFVQNRCYARTGWDHQVRALCKARGIVYQGFSLLTANTRELASKTAMAIARRAGATVPEVVFAFAHAVGMLPLTGTTDAAHMREDLASLAITLTAAEVDAMERIAG